MASAQSNSISEDVIPDVAPGTADRDPAVQGTAQLVLLRKGSPQYTFPRVLDINAKFASVPGNDDEGRTITVGRDSECDVQIPTREVTPERGADYVANCISRKHCTITRRRCNGSWEYMVKDLGSVNGTFINWRKLEAKVPSPLRKGDRLCFGAGGVLDVGAVLPEEPLANWPPVVYYLNTDGTPSPRGPPNPKVNLTTEADQVFEYSQVSLRSDSSFSSHQKLAEDTPPESLPLFPSIDMKPEPITANDSNEPLPPKVPIPLERGATAAFIYDDDDDSAKGPSATPPDSAVGGGGMGHVKKNPVKVKRGLRPVPQGRREGEVKEEKQGFEALLATKCEVADALSAPKMVDGAP
eukprot:Sspe_Gene.10760::Locus_3614_Transcript_1_1_Confidence_1.000_Length_1127::g.10760::m.10760